MTFDEWHKSLCCESCDTHCPHKEWERKAWNAAVAAEREACDVDCAERLGAERLAFAVESEERNQRIVKLREQLHKISVECFGSDVPDAPVDAIVRRIRELSARKP